MLYRIWSQTYVLQLDPNATWPDLTRPVTGCHDFDPSRLFITFYKYARQLKKKQRNTRKHSINIVPFSILYLHNVTKTEPDLMLFETWGQVRLCLGRVVESYGKTFDNFVSQREYYGQGMQTVRPVDGCWHWLVSTWTDADSSLSTLAGIDFNWCWFWLISTLIGFKFDCCQLRLVLTLSEVLVISV